MSFLCRCKAQIHRTSGLNEIISFNHQHFLYLSFCRETKHLDKYCFCFVLVFWHNWYWYSIANMFLSNSLDKTLMLRKIEGKGRRKLQCHQLNDMNLSRLWKIEDWKPWRAAVHAVAKTQTWICDWQHWQHDIVT